MAASNQVWESRSAKKQRGRKSAQDASYISEGDMDNLVDQDDMEEGETAAHSTKVPTKAPPPEHAKVLGVQETTVYAAVRSYLNKSTLESAGGSSAYCIVLHSPFPQCCSER